MLLHPDLCSIDNEGNSQNSILFQIEKRWYLPQCYSDKMLQETAVNRVFKFLNRGSHEIASTVSGVNEITIRLYYLCNLWASFFSFLKVFSFLKQSVLNVTRINSSNSPLQFKILVYLAASAMSWPEGDPCWPVVAGNDIFRDLDNLN